MSDFEEALFASRPQVLFKPEDTEYKIFKGCLDNESDRMECEAILTKAYQCSSEMKKAGDIIIHERYNTFDKEGCYHVVIIYLQLTRDLKNKNDDEEEKEYYG